QAGDGDAAAHPGAGEVTAEGAVLDDGGPGREPGRQPGRGDGPGPTQPAPVGPGQVPGDDGVVHHQPAAVDHVDTAADGRGRVSGDRAVPDVEEVPGRDLDGPAGAGRGVPVEDDPVQGEQGGRPALVDGPAGRGRVAAGQPQPGQGQAGGGRVDDPEGGGGVVG